MTNAEHESLLPIDHVFHPTDLSRASEVAFAHALRAALAVNAALTIFHVVARLAQALGATPHVGLLHVGSPGTTGSSMR